VPSGAFFIFPAGAEDEIPKREVMFVTASEIAHKLHGRKSGAGWAAPCPAYDDKAPSLSLRDVEERYWCTAMLGATNTE